MCIHHWATLTEPRTGHTLWVCANEGCSSQVDYTVVRKEWDRRKSEEAIARQLEANKSA